MTDDVSYFTDIKNSENHNLTQFHDIEGMQEKFALHLSTCLQRLLELCDFQLFLKLFSTKSQHQTV